MPTYEYACNQCGHELEAFQLMSAAPLVQCPACESPSLKRKIGRGAGLIFKGGGFYETDFKEKKGKADDSPSKAEASSKPDDSSKPETKVSAENKEAPARKAGSAES